MWKTKDMNLDRKVYTNYFANIAPMILATVTNTVLKIIDLDKMARWVHLTKIKPELDQNQQIQSEIYLHRKNNYYSAMASTAGEPHLHNMTKMLSAKSA